MSPEEAWFTTPREAYWFIAAAGWRHEQTFRLAMRTAYYSGAIARSGGTLPTFDEMFPDPRSNPPKPTTPEETWAWWCSFAQRVNATQETPPAEEKV